MTKKKKDPLEIFIESIMAIFVWALLTFVLFLFFNIIGLIIGLCTLGVLFDVIDKLIGHL